MPDTYVDSDIVGFNHHDALDANIDTYQRLAPIINMKDNPAIGPEIANNLSILQQGPNEKFPDIPKISLEDALVSTDPIIKQNALDTLNQASEQTPEAKYNLGRTLESNYDTQLKKYLTKDFGYSVLRDNEDFYYNNDYLKNGWFMRNIVKNPLRFIGRVAVPAVLKLGEGLGYVGSMLTSIGSNNYWASVADNGFSRWLEGLEQDYKDQLIPVYKRAGFDEKGFFSKLADWSFWNDEVADGVAFMASAALPGTGLAKLGTLGKFGEAFSAASKIGKLASGAGLGSWAELTSWTFNTAMEASQEGAGVFKEMKKRLTDLRDSGDPRYANLTDQEIDAQSGSMAANTIAANFAILGLSNAWENSLFFKRFKPIEGRAAIQIGEDFAAGSKAISQLEKTGVRAALDISNPVRRIPFYGKKIIGGIVAEGLWEENAQLAVQRMNQGDTEGRGFFPQYWKQIKDAFAGRDPEAADSIGLGGLIGAGAGVAFTKAANERREMIESTKQALLGINAARQNLHNTTDIYVRDTTNKIVFEGNKPKVDPVKLQQKKAAMESVFGKLSFANKDEFLSSEPVQFQTQKALADYVRSLANSGITGISERLRTLNGENAALFGLDPESANPGGGRLAEMADVFERLSNEVEQKVRIPEKPKDVEEAEFARQIRNRKADTYEAISENAIVDRMITDKNSEILNILNQTRSLNNSSLSDFPIDTVNNLLQQKMSNIKFMGLPGFDQLSDREQQYHRDRDKELTDLIAQYEKDNEIALKESTKSPSGFYYPTAKNEDGTTRQLPFNTRAGVLSKSVSELNNIKHKNATKYNDFTNDKDGHQNWIDWTNSKEVQNLQKQVSGQPASKPAQFQKYREQKPGDFNKVMDLVAKMVFGENQEYSAEELQLQANYPALIEELIKQFEKVANEQTVKLQQKKIDSLRTEQKALGEILKKTQTELTDKKTAIDKLIEELKNVTDNKRANKAKINNAIAEFEKDIATLEATLDPTQKRLNAIEDEIATLDSAIQNGNFRGLYKALAELTAERDRMRTKVVDLQAFIQKMKDLVRQLRGAAYKLFGSKADYQAALAGDNPEAAKYEIDMANAKTAQSVAEDMLPQLEAIRDELNKRYQDNRKDIDTILAQTKQFFRDKYLDTSKAKPEKLDPEDDAINKGLTKDKLIFGGGDDSGGNDGTDEDVFDGAGYQRPLSTKFFTTTFPPGADISSQPQDVQDYFKFLNNVTNNFNSDELKKKLGKGKLRALVVTKNNVEALGLSEVLAERAEYFKNDSPGLTHFEIIPVIEEGGYHYYLDADLNRVGTVEDNEAKPNIIRRSLRTVKYTEVEAAQYSQKYSKDEMDKALKVATDWRSKMLENAKKNPLLTFEFSVTRGIANKMQMQDGGQATNAVPGLLLPENKVSGQTVRVFSEVSKNQVINAENVELPVGRPFIYTTTGIGDEAHEQLHAANNTILTEDQVKTVTAVFKEMMTDHLQKVEKVIAASKSFPQNLKDAIEKAGGLVNLDIATKKKVYLAVTKESSTTNVNLLNTNLTQFLSSVVYFGPLQQGKAAGTNQIFFKGPEIVFGYGGHRIDITDPTAVDSAEVQAFLARQFHNIKYFPDTKKAEKQYTEYYLDKDGKLQTRVWKNYSHYLLMPKLPSGETRTSIPITTAIKTAEQHAAEATTNPYYQYSYRGIILAVNPKTAITKNKSTKTGEEKPKSQGGLAKTWSNVLAKHAAEKGEVVPTDEEVSAGEQADKGSGKKKGPGLAATWSKLTKNAKNKQAEPEEKTEEVTEEAEEEVTFDNIVELGGFTKPSDEDEDDLGDPFRVAKSGPFKVEADLDNVIEYIRRVVPQFPVERLKNVIKQGDIEAWGQFVDNTIKLYELGEEGTGYHEVFEAVVNKLLSRQEWDALHREFKSRKGYFTDRESGARVKFSEANAHQAKEQIAEEFRDYKLTGKLPSYPQTRSYLKIIWDFIKKLVGRISGTPVYTRINDLFQAIDREKLATRTPGTSDRFANNFRRLPNVSTVVRRDLYHGATAIMFKNLFYTPNSLVELDEIDETDETIYEPIKAQFLATINRLQNKLKDTKDGKKRQAITRAIKDVQYAVDNWGAFVDGHKSFLKPFRIRFEEEERSTKFDTEDIQNRNDYTQDTFKTDGKRSASKSIRFLFGTLLQLEFDKEGAVDEVNGKKIGRIKPVANTVNMHGLVNYDEYMLKALDAMKGLNDFTRVEQRLAELAGIPALNDLKNPEAQVKYVQNMQPDQATWTNLYTRLFGTSEKISEEAAWNLKVKFHNYVSKHSPEPYIFINGGGTSTIISSTKRSFYESVMRKIESSIATNANLIFERSKKDRTFRPIKAFRETTTRDAFLAQPAKGDSHLMNFVKFLGLEDEINKNFLDSLTSRERIKIENKLLVIRNALTKVNTPTLSIAQLDIFGYVNNLISDLDAKLNVGQRTNQFLNIGNEAQQIYVIPSFVSRIISEINNVSNISQLIDKYPMLGTVFAQDSILLSRLFDPETGDRTSAPISLGYMEGVKDLDEQEGGKTAKLEFSDKYFLQFNAALSGLYYSLPADSETEWVFNYGEFVPYQENLLDVDGDRIAAELFLPKLKTELDMALTHNSKLLQLNAKHKSTDSEIGKSLRFFKDILQYTDSGKNNLDLVKDIQQAINNGVDSEQIIVERQEAIIAAIKNYLRQESLKMYGALSDNRLISESDGTYSIRGLNNQFINKNQSLTTEGGLVKMTDPQVTGLVQYVKINTILANMETFKVIFGDPAQYKDWEKRAKSLFGPIEQTFNESTNEFNFWLNKNKNFAELGDTKVELNDEWFATYFSNWINSRTVDDLEVVDIDTVNDLSKSEDELVKRYLSSYEETNEVDGQSIGTLGFARHLMIKSGWRWSAEHEKFWQYDSALMRQELSQLPSNHKNFYNYEDNNTLRELDAKIVEYYKENPPMATISPVKTLMPYQDEEGNQHLLKHSVYFQSYQLAKEFELLDNYVKMLKAGDALLNFRSAEKVGLTLDDEGKITSYYQDPFTHTDIDAKGNPTSVIDLRQVGIQVETQTSGKGQTLGSQTTKLSNLNMSEDGVPIDYLADDPERISKWNNLSDTERLAESKKYQLLKGPNGTITTLQNMKTKNALDTFTRLGVDWKYNDNGEITYDIKDLSKIKQFILDELQRLEVDENTIDNIQLSEDLKSFVNPAETLPSYTTISNLLWSMADKAITSMKVNGKPYIQMSSAFFNKAKSNGAYRTAAYKDESGKWIEIDNKKDYDALVAAGKKLVMTSSDLKFYRRGDGKTLGMEIYLPNIYLAKVNAKRVARGMDKLSAEELMDHLNKNPKLLEGIGFRIPTQATSSIEFFTIKGFLPESMGSSIVVPSAITTKAGSDFDVDKLNTYLNNWKMDKRGLPMYEEMQTDENSTLDDRHMAYVRAQTRNWNQVWDDMRGSEEYESKVEAILANERAIEGSRDFIQEAKDEEKITYRNGLHIFSQLPVPLKQQYYNQETNYRLSDIHGEEKILNYVAYTTEWLDKFRKEGVINLNKRTRKGGTVIEPVSLAEVESHLEALLANYHEVLAQMGITKELIDEYLQIKGERLDENDRIKKDFFIKLSDHIAKAQGFLSKEDFGKLPLFLQNTKGALENAYFQSIRNILEQPDMFDYLLSPNSIAHIRNNRDEVERAKDPNWQPEDKKEVDYTNWLSNEWIAQKRNEFTKGKYDIGIFAVAMTNYANSQVVGLGITGQGGVKDADSYVFDELNDSNIELPFEDIQYVDINGVTMISISKMKDVNGDLIMDKISAYINGAVDVAKEPLIIQMGMHTELAGTYILMERMGLSGKTTALFLQQPAVREWLQELLFLNSKTYFSYTPFQWPKDITEALVRRYGGEYPSYNPDFRLTDEAMAQMIRKGELMKTDPNLKWTDAEKNAQYHALVNFLKIRMYSQHLLESVQASNHDTASMRSPWVLTRKDLQLDRAKTGNVITTVQNDKVKNGAESLREGTFVNNDINLFRIFNKIMSKINLFALQRDNPQNTLLNVAQRVFNQNPFMTNDDFTKVMREYETSMIDSLVNNILTPKLQMNPKTKEQEVIWSALWKNAGRLFKIGGTGSLRNMLKDIKKEYPNYAKENFFLKNLEINPNSQLGVDIMELRMKPGNSDVITKEMITEALLSMAELDEKSYPKITRFYRSIIYGSFLQNGMRFSRRSFVDLLPVSGKADEVSNRGLKYLTDITRPALSNIDNEDFSTFDEMVQRSKWYKKDIVPERTLRAMQFISKTKDGWKLDKDAKWAPSDKAPYPKVSQIFFGDVYYSQNDDGTKTKHIVPGIKPALIWQGHEDNYNLFKDAPTIISVPGVRPEFLDRVYRFNKKAGQEVWQWAVKPIVYSMMKKGDYSYLFSQLYKKVGTEDATLGRAVIGKKNKAGKRSVYYVYKPINKYGSRDFNEMQPLSVSDAGIVSGQKSILNFPEFDEIDDVEFIKGLVGDDFRPVASSVASVNTGPSLPLLPKNARDEKGKKIKTLNVWYKTGENALFSNLAARPFTYDGRSYLSVEHAYQTLKSGEFDEVTYKKYTKAGQKIAGRKKANTEDNYNITLMKDLMKQSFIANPDAARSLKNTGSAEFTHLQDNGVWAKEFPRLLSEVRDELIVPPDGPPIDSCGI